MLCDFAEENWPSMDLVASMLLDRLNRGEQSGVRATRIQPMMKRRVVRWLGSEMGRNADRLWNRYWDYPRFLPSLPAFDLFHVIDHSYAQLVNGLPPERTVVTCHDTDTFRCLVQPEEEPRPFWFRAAVRRTLNGLAKAGAIVCVSEATRRQVLAYQLAAPERVHVVHNGIHPCFQYAPDIFADQAVDELFGPRESACELLHVGSTIFRKRVDVLLRVFAACKERQPALRLIRVGAAFTPAQQDLARELGVEQAIKCLPFLEQGLLAAVYRRAALTLVPSEAEGFGLPLAESMACGTPVVASEIPSLREVGGDAGAYCGVANLEKWTESVLALLAERTSDAVAWQSRVARGRNRALQFSWDRNARETTAIYRGLLSQN